MRTLIASRLRLSAKHHEWALAVSTCTRLPPAFTSDDMLILAIVKPPRQIYSLHRLIKTRYCIEVLCVFCLGSTVPDFYVMVTEEP